MIVQEPPSQVPKHLSRASNEVMTNFDHSIDEVVANLLKEGKHFAQYSAWNFCGYVWWDSTRWACEVWQYNEPLEVIRAETLEEMMELVSDKYGAE